MEFTTHLIKAGALLNLFGIVHRDIHQGNILIDTDQVPRLIDFNLAVPVERPLTAGTLSHTYSLDIAQEPPDSTLVNAISHSRSYSTIIDSIIFKKHIMKKIQLILGVTSQEMYYAFKQFYSKSISVKAGDTVAWFHMYWRKIDSWAIGINLVDLISRLSILPAFEPMLDQYKQKLFPLLKRMCAVSPIDRIDCVQALYYLDPTHFIIKKYAAAWMAKVGNGNI
jgi:serine/threonine protein kinase